MKCLPKQAGRAFCPREQLPLPCERDSQFAKQDASVRQGVVLRAGYYLQSPLGWHGLNCSFVQLLMSIGRKSHRRSGPVRTCSFLQRLSPLPLLNQKDSRLTTLNLVLLDGTYHW